MHKAAKAILVLCMWMSSAHGKVVVFWQEGFPTLESQPVRQETLHKALDSLQPEFADLDELSKPETLRHADLLVLPYGSAVPADAWAAVVKYVQAGGNLLVLGGRAFVIPVRKQGGGYLFHRSRWPRRPHLPDAIRARHALCIDLGILFVWYFVS